MITKEDQILIDEAIQTLTKGVFGFDLYNPIQLSEVLKHFEAGFIEVMYITDFYYVRRKVDYNF